MGIKEANAFQYGEMPRRDLRALLDNMEREEINLGDEIQVYFHDGSMEKLSDEEMLNQTGTLRPVYSDRPALDKKYVLVDVSLEYLEVEDESGHKKFGLSNVKRIEKVL